MGSTDQKTLVNTMNKFNTHGKKKFCFNFWLFCLRLTWNKFLKVLNNLIDFCFDAAKIYILKLVVMFLVGYQNNQIGLTKLQIKDLVIYSLSNCYFIVGSGILCHINGILMRSGPAPFFHNLFINFYESNCMNEKKEMN